MEKRRRKILGWCLLIPRIIIMTCSSISLFCAYSMQNIVGIISSGILTAIYLMDVIYLIVLIIHDFVTKKDDPSLIDELGENIKIAKKGEQEIFNIYKEDKEP